MENSICFIKIKDDPGIEGLFYKAGKNNIQLWKNQRLISIPINSVIKMKYWKEYKTVYWGSIVGSAIIGLLGAEFINTIADLSNEDI